MSAALASESPTAIGRAAWFLAYLHRDFGSLDQAHQVVEDALRHLDAAPARSGELLWQRGTVRLASAWNYAREYRPALAWRAWDAAVEARSRSRMPDPPDVLFAATIDDVALARDVELGAVDFGGCNVLRRSISKQWRPLPDGHGWRSKPPAL